MSEQLTQRIAAEFVRHDLHLEWVGVDRTANGLLRTYCLCGWKGEPRTAGPANETVVAAALRLDGAVHVARVLVTELGLDEELSRSAFPKDAGKRRRYVTPWEPRARAVGAELTIQEES